MSGRSRALPLSLPPLPNPPPPGGGACKAGKRVAIWHTMSLVERYVKCKVETFRSTAQ